MNRYAREEGVTWKAWCFPSRPPGGNRRLRTRPGGLDSSLGLTGPALVGAVFAALTLLPLIALALRGTTGPSRIVAHHTTDTYEPQTATTSAH
ncbi:hypothetical protein [Streptomyces sp. MCL20-2]|uniref:hypothetical protein n=1 Tax=Streptomyces sp. MCL20-2 TaxID=2967219 RepID=UPI002966DBD0|nr:hypothetical protein [Streptomyces sp. MCL20-2]